MPSWRVQRGPRQRGILRGDKGVARVIRRWVMMPCIVHVIWSLGYIFLLNVLAMNCNREGFVTVGFFQPYRNCSVVHEVANWFRGLLRNS